MKKINKLSGLFFVILFLVIPSFSYAQAPTPYILQTRENVTDWYIHNFESVIEVRENSTLLITEKITADCGNAPDKHGIFRVLPTQLKTFDKIIPMPVRMVSITDFSGKNIPYSETKNLTDKTITWKIGDKNKTVNGVNQYEIIYEVGNVINFDDYERDELYWNLTGNFWNIEIDHFSAKIIFPSGISEVNSRVEYYTGDLEENKKNATYQWIDKNVLSVTSTKMLKAQEGITLSVAFPKNIIAPYEFSFWEKYHDQILFFLGMIIFFISFTVAFLIWRKYGKDPQMNKTIIAEFEVPEKLTPMEMGMLMSNGKFKKDFITAEIIYLATRGIITINESEKKILNFRNKIFLKNDNFDAEATLGEVQKLILKGIFGKNKTKKLSELKNSFFKTVEKAKEKTKDSLIDRKLINKTGLTFKGVFLALFVVFSMLTFFFILQFIAIGFFLSAFVFLTFAFFMPQKTPQGAQVYWKIQGFRLYMETAEKYRQQFYEKENIFEKLLPYAIVFGIAKLWAKKMEEIYGQDYFKNYHPIWYTGIDSNFGSFDASSFTSSLNSVSSGISSNISSGSGVGGGGGSGGGGGGGGGGGW